MNKKLISFVTVVLGCSAVAQQSQPAQPAAGAATAPSVPRYQQGVQTRQPVPPNIDSRRQYIPPPGRPGSPVPIGTPPGGTLTNVPGGYPTTTTTPGSGTNLPGPIETTNITGTGNTTPPGVNTNSVTVTNTVSTTNQVVIRTGDRFFSPMDQTLLVRIREEILPMSGSGQPWAPVHFAARQGVVTIMGFVPDPQSKQQLILIVRRTPGVLQVVDDLRVGAELGSNDSAVPATSAPSAPSAASAVQTPNLIEDQAVTAGDRNILVELHQGIQPIIGNSEPVKPIHFALHDGVVTVIGFIPNEFQHQQVINIVQRTPGVLRVIDQLKVNAQVNATTGGGAVTGAGAQNPAVGNVAAGSQNLSNAVGTQPNVTPTGRTNSITYPDTNASNGLPPGLQNRQQLPPGLDQQQPANPSR